MCNGIPFTPPRFFPMIYATGIGNLENLESTGAIRCTTFVKYGVRNVNVKLQPYAILQMLCMFLLKRIMTRGFDRNVACLCVLAKAPTRFARGSPHVHFVAEKRVLILNANGLFQINFFTHPSFEFYYKQDTHLSWDGMLLCTDSLRQPNGRTIGMATAASLFLPSGWIIGRDKKTQQ